MILHELKIFTYFISFFFLNVQTMRFSFQLFSVEKNSDFLISIMQYKGIINEEMKNFPFHSKRTHSRKFDALFWFSCLMKTSFCLCTDFIAVNKSMFLYVHLLEFRIAFFYFFYIFHNSIEAVSNRLGLPGSNRVWLYEKS